MNRVFITGASSGLGRALAQRYAETGATLACWAVARRLRELAASLPGQHRCYAVDVRDRQARMRPPRISSPSARGGWTW